MSVVTDRYPKTRRSEKVIRGLPFSYRSLGAVMVAFDLVLIVATSLATGTLYHLVTLGSYGDTAVFAGTGLLAGYLFVSVLMVRGAYQPARSASRHPGYGELSLVWLCVFLALAGMAFVFHVSASFSRGAVLSFFVVGLTCLLARRAVMTGVMRQALGEGRLTGPQVVFIGHDAPSTDADHVRDLRRYGYRVVHQAMLASGTDEASAVRLVTEVLAVARSERVDEVVIALPWSRLPLIERIAVGLQRLPVPVRLLPDGPVGRLMLLPSCDLGASVALELQRGPLTAYQRGLKRAFDLTSATLGLIAISPLLAMVAIAIRYDSPGPILFRQVRTGYAGRPFRIFKFRTMRVLEDGDVIAQARKGDDRVTRVGRWLRRTSIDELPQLLNVLSGDMSLVGPRPHALAHDVEYGRLIDQYGYRFQVKPGITGWAQVNGFRGQTSTVDMMQSRVECDLWYISNWSLMLDIKTVIRTFGAQMRADNAY